MDSDSDKENYFSLYMKKKKSDIQKKANFRSNKRFKNQCASSQKLKGENKNSNKLLLESSEKIHQNKNTFSFVKSYLINLENKNKMRHSTKNINIQIEKQKIKTEKFNKSSSDIKKIAISIPKNEHENDNKKDNNQKIEKLKNRIFNLIDIINDFENNFIKSKKPLQIKEQFVKIKYKIKPNELKLNKDKNKDNKNMDVIESINNFNIDNENFSKTERLNYASKEKLLKNKNNKISYVYTKLFEDLNNINNLEENKNIIHTKRTNGMRQHSAVNPRISSDKNIAIILLNRQKDKSVNNNKKTINNNSTFLNLISSNLIIKNELKKVSSNFTKNKSKSLVNKMNINSHSSSNKTLYNQNENLDEKEKKKNIFKRRINYSNFINQKIKQNIMIQRNNGSYLKQNTINKSIINNKSKECNTCFDANHNDNYIKNMLNKNNKSKSIDKSNLNGVKSVNNLNPLNL